MNEPKPQLSKSNSKSSDYGPSPTKSQAEMRRQKKKKMAAFKTFLNHVEPQVQQDPLIKRRLSIEVTEQKLEPDPQCKICKNPYADKGKQCSFCHDIVCSSHIRKKRRDANNKFTRICDLCEDTYIYKRYLKNQMKVQETLVAQELLLQVKAKELQELLNGKKTKLIVLKNKAQELQAKTAKETQKYTTQKTDVERRLRKFQQKMLDISKLQKQLLAMQKRLPPSLQTDYEVLQQQNDKITKDLVKHEKWCNDVIKARSIREKKMYEQYYEWQLMQKNKRELQQKKEQECDIY